MVVANSGQSRSQPIQCHLPSIISTTKASSSYNNYIPRQEARLTMQNVFFWSYGRNLSDFDDYHYWWLVTCVSHSRTALMARRTKTRIWNGLQLLVLNIWSLEPEILWWSHRQWKFDDILRSRSCHCPSNQITMLNTIFTFLLWHLIIIYQVNNTFWNLSSLNQKSAPNQSERLHLCQFGFTHLRWDPTIPFLFVDVVENGGVWAALPSLSLLLSQRQPHTIAYVLR